MERLDFGKETAYNAVESAIHLNRYAIARPYIKGKRVLDAASGEGYGSYLMKMWGAESVDGLDIDEETVEQAKRIFGSEKVKFQCHTVEELPFPDYFFDVVCSFETIEHIDHPDAFLKEMKRVLKPGGTIIISCPNDPYYYKQGTPGNPFHKRQYTFWDFKKEAEQYLGSGVRYLLAFALNGFVNVPFEYATLPPEGDEQDPLPTDMLELFHFKECSNTMMVAGERYLNYWNANYYVGIWNMEAMPTINASIFPRETFVEFRDKDVSLLHDAAKSYERVQKLQKELEEKNTEEEKLQLTQETVIREKDLEIQRLSMSLELANKEMNTLWQRIEEAGKAEEQLSDARQALSVKDLEIQRLSMSLELANKEKGALWQRIEDAGKTEERLSDARQALSAKDLEIQRLSMSLELYNKEQSAIAVKMSRKAALKEKIKASWMFKVARKIPLVRWMVWKMFKKNI